MPVCFGGQSQQRWGDNTLNPQEYLRDLLLSDTTGTQRSTALARKAGMLVLAFVNLEDAASQQTVAALQTLSNAYGASGKAAIWAVSVQDFTTTAAQVQQHNLSLPVLVDHDGYHATNYGITSVPTVFFVDSKGVVLQKTTGWYPQGVQQISERLGAFLEMEPVSVA